MRPKLVIIQLPEHISEPEFHLASVQHFIKIEVMKQFPFHHYIRSFYKQSVTTTLPQLEVEILEYTEEEKDSERQEYFISNLKTIAGAWSKTPLYKSTR